LAAGFTSGTLAGRTRTSKLPAAELAQSGLGSTVAAQRFACGVRRARDGPVGASNTQRISLRPRARS